MINEIMMYLGYGIIILLMLIFFCGLIVFVYYLYDYWIKKVLCWDNIEIRKNIFYFMKHEKEIKEYIRKNRK